MISWTGRYRVGFDLVLHYCIVKMLIVNDSFVQANIYCGFAIWTVGSGCLSTVTPSTNKGLLVFYMLLSGIGAGGVSWTLPSHGLTRHS